MGKSVLYVGLDVHKMSMDVAIAEAGPGAEVRFYGQIGGDLDSLDRVIRKFWPTGAQLRFAYEAGPCGYVVYRHLTARGWPCLVAAPSASSPVAPATASNATAGTPCLWPGCSGPGS